MKGPRTNRGSVHEVGSAHSSEEAPVMEVERRGCVSRSRSRDEGCSAFRNRLIGSRLRTA
ncbi:hypothetical protein [Pasteuria penetrans]|uniref:hypothetical protein n=1 Tax=Pasteuria penetrans TaxID=86005 RepID=UPI0011EE6298|nr:hypothetical protein [Pasteuria penetrans]